MLYEPAHVEPLTEEPWDPGHVEDAIATIVAETGDVGTALFAAACLDVDARAPILDIV